MKLPGASGLPYQKQYKSAKKVAIKCGLSNLNPVMTISKEDREEYEDNLNIFVNTQIKKYQATNILRMLAQNIQRSEGKSKSKHIIGL